MTKQFDWTCEICGKIGKCGNKWIAKRGKMRHYQRYHPEVDFAQERRFYVTNDLIREMRKASSSLCGDECIYYTGKSVCLRGNISTKGEVKPCYFTEAMKRGGMNNVSMD